MAFGGLKGSLVGNNLSTTASNTITGSVVVAVGDLVFAVMAEAVALTANACSDNLGNTYTAQNAGTLSGSAISGRAYWSRVTNAGTLTTVTITATASSDDFAGTAAVIEGPLATSPLDANPANITSDITSPFTCPATGTLAQSNEIVIAWGVRNSSSVWAATSPNLLARDNVTSTSCAGSIGYQAVTATTSVVPAFTAAANPTADVLGTVSFKGVATGIAADVTEAATATEAESVTASFVSSITEAATAATTQTVTASFVAARVEAAAATDTVSATVNFAVSIIEAATATEIESAAVNFAASVLESATATETESVLANFFPSIVEAANAITTQNATTGFAVSASEAAAATDITNAVNIPTVAVHPRLVRDPWDCDEYGNFFPGAGMHSIT